MQNLPYSIDDLRKMYVERKIIWRDHAFDKMIERGITRNEIRHCIMNGEIIEEYPEDYPFPSCLILGYTVSNRPIHVVCSTDSEYIYIITAYEPNLFKWHEDFKTRRKS